jgi:predicted RNA-binding protein YlxR (DUF448 family)
LGCGAKDDQSELLRLVIRNDELIIDPSGKGRGGYLHKAEACWQAFLRRRSVYRAFHVEVGKIAKEKLVRALCTRHWE